ncbi:hypothetical protein [Streptomyces sp. NPDC006739]|uniref:hypothetical protein n=1 Tax=Streptomyces sp. NPDC006739 TaxID=3364763 RepID=UPI00368622AE
MAVCAAETRCAPALAADREQGFQGQPYPVHRAEEIAAAVCCLVSDLARGVNGTARFMDFGALARSALPA